MAGTRILLASFETPDINSLVPSGYAQDYKVRDSRCIPRENLTLEPETRELGSESLQRPNLRRERRDPLSYRTIRHRRDRVQCKADTRIVERRRVLRP